MKIKTLISSEASKLDEMVSDFEEEQKINFSQTHTYHNGDGDVFHKITLFFDAPKKETTDLGDGIKVEGNTVAEKIRSIEELK